MEKQREVNIDKYPGVVEMEQIYTLNTSMGEEVEFKKTRITYTTVNHGSSDGISRPGDESVPIRNTEMMSERNRRRV